jgi:hypothetical protein
VGVYSRLRPSDLHEPDDSNRSVLPALSHAFAENLSALRVCAQAGGALATRSDKKAHEAEAMQLAQDALRLAQNLKALARWIYPRKVLPLEEAVSKAQAFRELGDEWVESMCRALQTFPEGAPPRTRQSHIDAFEYMLQSKKHSLGRATREFCTCGGDHTEKCRERLKTGIRSLKKMLREYAPDLVTRSDSLHADRGKKGA